MSSIATAVPVISASALRAALGITCRSPQLVIGLNVE